MVLSGLQPFIESSEIADKETPVLVCRRYIKHRLHRMHYKETFAKGLPIGSGQVKNAHRYVAHYRRCLEA